MGRHEQRILSVVIPLYREGAHFEQSFEEIRRQLEKIPCRYEIILVDDGSTDNTWDIVRELIRQHNEVAALRFSRSFGKEAAISAGLENAKGDAVIVVNGDLHHPPQFIVEMYRLWSEEGIEIVNAVKLNRGKGTLFHRFGTGAFTLILNRLSGFNMSAATDFKLLDRRVVDAWLQMGETQLFYRGMAAWLGFKRAEIPFDVKEHQQNRSTWSGTGLIVFALTALTSFTSAPLQIVSALGVLFFIMAMGLGGRTLVLWIGGEAVTGFATVILLQLIIGGCIMISLSIIGHYISNIYLEVKRRPRYVLAERIVAHNLSGDD